MHIGTKIKIARITKGLTQEGLAEKINKTRPLVSHIEQTGKANIYTLKKICNVLDLDITEIQNEIFEPRINHVKEEATLKTEIRRLKEEISILKELVQSQKDMISELKEKLGKKNHKK